ncbi:Hypothetical protein PHPALM_5899 [Phytophthora palmivora]|uniref:HAT C-terminal dimerisation domain-containing protein n=1 Tax=Phytophthora palmivora TaxID=4796 RepID=A0A2P4YG74_9STRA|nr:Hypothetical protein PHPALM_5899 [Phytophthora palmivora]
MKGMEKAKGGYTYYQCKYCKAAFDTQDGPAPRLIIGRPRNFMHADNHLPDRFIEKESVLRLLELLCPGIRDILPSRRVLGGRILKEHAKRCTTKYSDALGGIQNETGGRVNVLAGVWQNIAKDHLLGVQLVLFGVILTYSLLPVGDRHDGIVIAEDLEKVLKRAHSEKWNIGAIVTDNAGQCGRARRILTLRWPQIVVLHCFAHDSNNLVKAVLKTSVRDVGDQAAAAVNCINASSSKWLKRTKQLMEKIYGRTLGLRSLCETRWNSMQGCFASLLRVQSALQMLYRQYEKDKNFPSDLKVLGDMNFWSELKNGEAVISPLSYASYRLQRDENTVGDVVLSYREIYLGFKDDIIHRNDLIKCVEERWLQCEQPLFMLGFALHPIYADDARGLPDTIISGIGTLPAVAVYYYRRLFATEAIGVLRSDIFAWMQAKFTRTKPSEFGGSVSEYWSYVAKQRPKSLLPKLAIAVLSIVVNTATCERLFSALGLIHTAKRNHMSASNALDIETVAKHVRQRALKAASRDPRKKLLINPVEHEILRDASGGMFTPSPQKSLIQTDSIADYDSDDEDPGDMVDGVVTLSLWNEYLAEVFEDDEIETDQPMTPAIATRKRRLTTNLKIFLLRLSTNSLPRTYKIFRKK